jgi:hypothetical protein
VFNFLSLGLQETILLLMLACPLIAIPLVVVVLVLFFVRRSAQATDSSALPDPRAEVERSSAEVERLQNGGDEPGPAEDRPGDGR